MAVPSLFDKIRAVFPRVVDKIRAVPATVLKTNSDSIANVVKDCIVPR
jgi:hypothetical protein